MRLVGDVRAAFASIGPARVQASQFIGRKTGGRPALLRHPNGLLAFLVLRRAGRPSPETDFVAHSSAERWQEGPPLRGWGVVHLAFGLSWWRSEHGDPHPQLCIVCLCRCVVVRACTQVRLCACICTCACRFSGLPMRGRVHMCQSTARARVHGRACMLACMTARKSAGGHWKYRPQPPASKRYFTHVRAPLSPKWGHLGACLWDFDRRRRHLSPWSRSPGGCCLAGCVAGHIGGRWASSCAGSADRCGCAPPLRVHTTALVLLHRCAIGVQRRSTRNLACGCAPGVAREAHNLGRRFRRTSSRCELSAPHRSGAHRFPTATFGGRVASCVHRFAWLVVWLCGPLTRSLC